MLVAVAVLAIAHVELVEAELLLDFWRGVARQTVRQNAIAAAVACY